MTPIYQKRPTRAGKTGDCFEACIASMLDLPLADVPDFTGGALEGDNVPLEHMFEANKWLAKRGMAYVEIGLNGTWLEVMRSLSGLMPNTLVVVIGRTRSGRVHAILCRNGLLAHDPAVGLIDVEDNGPALHLSLLPVHNTMYRVGFLALNL